MVVFEPDTIFRGYNRYIPPTFPSILPWSVFDRLRIGYTIPIIGTHPFRTHYNVTWHMKPETQTPHSKKYRLKRAICEGDIKEVSKILPRIDIDKPIDLNNHITPLMLAAKFNQIHIIKYLILKGANIEVKDPTGSTALMYAINNMSFEALRILIKNGSNMETEDIYGISPYKKTQLKNFYFMQMFLTEAKGKYSKPDFPRFQLNLEINQVLNASINAIIGLQGFKYKDPIPYPFNNLKETYLLSLINKSPTI